MSAIKFQKIEKSVPHCCTLYDLTCRPVIRYIALFSLLANLEIFLEALAL